MLARVPRKHINHRRAKVNGEARGVGRHVPMCLHTGNNIDFPDDKTSRERTDGASPLITARLLGRGSDRSLLGAVMHNNRHRHP